MHVLHCQDLITTTGFTTTASQPHSSNSHDTHTNLGLGSLSTSSRFMMLLSSWLSVLAVCTAHVGMKQPNKVEHRHKTILHHPYVSMSCAIFQSCLVRCHTECAVVMFTACVCCKSGFGYKNGLIIVLLIFQFLKFKI